MKNKNFILFLIPALVWGSTWYAIKLQLGVVQPLASVCYRFTLAGLILLAGCKILGFNMKYSFREHLFMALQGFTLFGINYWLTYLAEVNLASGLVAVIFSMMIFMNIVLNSWFFKISIKREVLLGAILGLGGTFLIFRNDFNKLAMSTNQLLALLYCFFSMILASLGNIISAYNQRNKLPVIQTNAFGMTYGAFFMIIIALIAGVDFRIEFTAKYISSLAYLSLFGSILAFTAYLKLLGNIGADRASYTILVTPVIAMIISTFFEKYAWQKSAVFGIILLLAGNYIAMNKKLKLKNLTLRINKK
jgi:drug/metabolite transporter (DMT)-like permease